MMKKISFVIIALMALVFTQCKPNGGDEGDAQKVKVRCVVPINEGERSEFAGMMNDGTIKWSTGTEYLYLAIPHQSTPQIVELTAFSTEQADILAFEGEVSANLLTNGKEYEIWYLGNSKNLNIPYINETRSNGVITSISGSVANQSGDIDDLGYCHMAKTTVMAKTDVDKVTLTLSGTLKNMMSIAYLDLTDVTSLSGTAIKGTEYKLQYNKDIENFEFVVVEDAAANINVTNGTANSYIILLPNEKADVVLECNKGGHNFEKGLESNKLYYRFVSNVEKYPLEWEIPAVVITAPIVTTNNISNVTTNTASCGGNVTSDGGEAVTARGICWSTYANPTIANNRTTNGSGTGAFTANMTNLNPNTTYYIRAYATNSVGTSYGEQKTFTTMPVVDAGKTMVFADGVTLNSGWYDVNKLKRAGADINMCWAAAASNIIQWWQDRYVAAGNTLPAGAVTGVGTKSYDGVGAYNLALMELYRDLWWNGKGGDVMQGVTWYFDGRNTQQYASSESCAQPNTTGGYYSNVWNDILPKVYHEYNYISLFDNLIVGEYLSWGGWSDLKTFSDLIVDSFKRGMASVVVSTASNGGNLHAITLWGYEIDNTTGILSKIWVTDSDDIHQGSQSGNPATQLLNEYAVTEFISNKRIKLSGSPYGSLFITGVYPVSGYNSK